MNCKKCNSTNLVKAGKTAYGTQVYNCKDCGYRGTMTGGISRKKHDKCSICGGKHFAKGLCSYHYYQQYYAEQTGQSVDDIKEFRGKCMICGRKHHAKGLCRKHYQQMKYHQHHESRHFYFR